MPAETLAATLATPATAADLLAHWWSRPLPEEVERWRGWADLERPAARAIGLDLDRPLAATTDCAADLLAEYERLFVGPARVPCPPYESYWRTDVPVGVRRTLMGPATAELIAVYERLGLCLPPGGELPDHLAVELEATTAALLLAATPEAAELLTEHLGRFVPQLCDAVETAAQQDFYRGLARLTTEWLAALTRTVLEPATDPPS